MEVIEVAYTNWHMEVHMEEYIEHLGTIIAVENLIQTDVRWAYIVSRPTRYRHSL